MTKRMTKMAGRSSHARPCRIGPLLSLLAAGLPVASVALAGPVGEVETLVASGAVWRFRTGETDPGVAWREPGFGDDLWAAGRAELGYGDGDEVTVVPRPPGESRSPFITTYFRHVFSLDDPRRFGRLHLQIKADDGAVVYLNGAEVRRINLPPGPVGFETLTPEFVAGEDEDLFLPFDLGDIGERGLVAGENLLAVEVHQVSETSSDLSFDLELTGELDPGRARAEVEAGGVRYRLHAEPPRVEREGVEPGADPLEPVFLEAPAPATDLWVEGNFFFVAAGGEVIRYDIGGGGRFVTPLETSYFDPVAVVEAEADPVGVRVEVGAAASGFVTVRNAGRGALSWVAAMEIPGAGAGGSPAWVSARFPGGVVPPGEVAEVEVRVNAAGLAEGEFLAVLVLGTDDPERPEVRVDVLARVQEPAVAEVTHGDIAYRLLDLPPRVEREVSPPAAPLPPVPLNSPAGALWVDDGGIYVGGGAGVTRYDLDGGSGSVVPGLDLTFFDPGLEKDPGAVDLTLLGGGAGTVGVTLRNTGRSPLAWQVGGKRREGAAPELEALLSRLDRVGAAAMTDPLVDPFYFTEGVTGVRIGDGGEDMYDSGNRLWTDLGVGIPYSDGVVATHEAFGEGGRYFTRKLPGLFVLVADLDGVSAFSVGGGLGADGSGDVDGAKLLPPPGSGGLSVFVKRVFGTQRPSVNHLVIVEGAASAAHSFPDDTDLDDHEVAGLLDAGRIHLLVFAREGGGYVDDPMAAAVAQAYLDVVTGGDPVTEVSPARGEIPPGGEVALEIGLGAAGLAPGGHNLEIDFVNGGPGLPTEVLGGLEIALTVAGSGIRLEPAQVRVAAVENVGFAPFELDLGVAGEGGPEEIDWVVEAAPPWLDVVPQSGRAPAAVTLTFDRLPGRGYFEGVVRISAGGSTYELPVNAEAFRLVLDHLLADRERPYLYGLHVGANIFDQSFLIFFESGEGRVVHAMPIGRSPTDMTVNYPEGRLYVTNRGWEETRVVDLETWDELEPLRLGTDVHRINAGRRGRIYIEARDPSDVAEVDTTTGEVLRRFGGEIVYVGDGEVDPTGRYYYHCNGGFDEDAVHKFDLDQAPPALVASSPEREFRSRTLVLSADGSRVFCGGYYFDADLRELGSGAFVDATTARGDLTFFSDGVFRVPTGRREADLPFAATLMAVAGNQRTLFLFQPESGELVGVPMADLAPFMGLVPVDGERLAEPPEELSFPAVTGAAAHEVFFGTDRDAVAAAVSGSVLHVGTVDDGAGLFRPGSLRAGRYYYWRVDALADDGTRVPGPVWEFALDHRPEAAVPGPRRGEEEHFGLSVSLDDDVALVGAPGRERQEPGAAYILRRVAGGVWILGEPLTRDGVDRDDAFGAAVAVSGETALVGAPGRDDGVGEAHFFTRDGGGNWVQDLLAVPAEPARSRFGQSVALLDDLALVGAPGTGGAGPEGYVYAYRWDYGAGGWTWAARLDAGPAGEAEEFGHSVALAPGWAAVGAPATEVDGIRGSGLVFLFTLEAGSGEWRPAGHIGAPQSSPNLFFGRSVALDGGWLAVGAPGDDEGLRDGGAVFLYRYEGVASGWVFVEKLIPADAVTAPPAMGASVSLSEGVLAAGGPNDDRVGNGFGAVFPFLYSDGRWRALPEVLARPGTLTDPGLGVSVALSGGVLLAGLPAALDAAEQEAGRVEFTALVDGTGGRPRFLSAPVTRVEVGSSYRYEVAAEVPGDEGLTLSAPALPGWLDMSTGEGGSAVLTGHPAASEVGVHHVQLVATSGSGRRAIQTFRVQVDLGELNEPPSSTGWAELENFPLENRGTVDLRSVFRDPDSPGLAFDVRSEVGAPVLLSAAVDGGAGELELVFRPGEAGTVDVRVRAADGGGRPVETIFRVTIPAGGGTPQFESFAGDRDGDGDGVSDLVEAVLGSAPSDPASRPWVRLERAPGGAVTLRWRSSPGYRFRVEGKDDLLEGAWFPVGVATATAETVSLSDGPGPGGPGAARFYRLVVEDDN